MLVRLGWSRTSTTYTFINAAPGYEEGPGSQQVVSSYAWNWGPKELAYGYVRAASTSVDSPEAGIFFKNLSSVWGCPGAAAGVVVA